MKARQVTAVLLAACVACDDDPIHWGDAGPADSPLNSATAVAFDSTHRLVPLTTVAEHPPAAAHQCVESARVAHDSGTAWYAVWWSLRQDSTADLVVAARRGAGTWSAPVRVDSTDVGRVGCDRPPPAIAVDGTNVHVVYAMTAREGPGIFASHSMDSGNLFHSPVPVVYGERLGLASIAARGDNVAVTYEDPNSNPQRIGLAFSRTLGHIFETRQTVSPSTGEARAPLVALDDSLIAVVWSQGPVGAVGGARLVRIGTLP